jgi:predicted dehydrogenase
MLEAGIVGAGDVAAGSHAPAYRQHPDVSLVSVCDIDDNKRSDFSKEYDIPREFSRAKKMFQSLDLDIVSICTPPHIHRDMVIDAAEAGIGIYCEKPIATTLEEARQMLSVINEASVPAAGGYALQFKSTFERAFK